jgi:hypothetical protein
MANAKRDENRIPTLLGLGDDGSLLDFKINPANGNLKVTNVGVQYHRAPIVSVPSSATTYVNTSSTYLSFSVLSDSANLNAVETVMLESGVLRNPRCQLISSSPGINPVVYVVKNGTRVPNMDITVVAGTVGTYENTVGSVSYEPGDRFCFEIERNDSVSHSFSSFIIDNLTTDGRSICLSGNVGGSNYNPSSNRFTRTNGFLAVGTAENALFSIIPNECTATNFGVYVSSNTRTSAVSVFFRVNQNDASPSTVITIPAGSTGWFYPPTQTNVPLSAGDFINWRINGPGSGTLIFNISRLTLIPTTAGHTPLLTGYTGLSTSSTSMRNSAFGSFWHTFTSLTMQATNYRTLIRGTGSIKNIYVWLLSNTSSGNTSYVLRNNNSPTSVAVTYLPSETGTKFNTSDTFNYIDGDSLDVQFSPNPGTGSVTTGTHSLTLISNKE